MNLTSNTSYYDIVNCTVDDDPESESFEFWTTGVMLNVIGILGIFGNIISMIILSRPQMKSSINYLLIGLARCDTVLILTSVLLFGIPAIYPHTGYLFVYYFNVYPHLAPVLFPLATIAQTVTVYLTLTVTLERFVAVCHPLRARSLCTYGRARIYVLVIIIFSVVYNLPRFWEVSNQANYYEALNTTIYCPIPSALRKNPTYISVYIHWMYLVFLYIFPFSSLAVLNAAIYRQVRKANAERQRLSRHQRREIGLATMLLCVVTVFFICNVLALVNNILEAFYGIINTQLVKISNLLVTINSSVNFIIYVIFGEKFKRLFLKLFCSHALFHSMTGRDSPDGATHDDSFMSYGDRHSIRVNRQNTTNGRNDLSMRINGSISGKELSQRRSARLHTSNPGPIVYYPAAKSYEVECSPSQTQTTIVCSEFVDDEEIRCTKF